MRYVSLVAWVVRLTFAFASCVSLGGCETASATEGPSAPRRVRTVATEPHRLSDARRVTGTLEAEHRVSLSPLVGGRIETVRVRVGDRVEANQALVTIAPGELRDALASSHASLSEANARAGAADSLSPARAAAEARVALAERALARAEALASVRGVTAEDLERARTDLELARSEREEARRSEAAIRALARAAASRVSLDRRSLSEAVVRAPFAGHIVQRTAEVGQVIAAGTAVLELIDDGPRRVRFEVPEDLVARIALGSVVQIVAATAPEERFAGEVIELSPALDAATRSRTAVAVLPHDPRLIPGGFASVELPLGEREVVGVPVAATLERGGITRAFVASGERAEERLLTVVRRDGPVVFVSSGVALGERVVLDPGALRDGESVIEGGAS